MEVKSHFSRCKSDAGDELAISSFPPTRKLAPAVPRKPLNLSKTMHAQSAVDLLVPSNLGMIDPDRDHLPLSGHAQELTTSLDDRDAHGIAFRERMLSSSGDHSLLTTPMDDEAYDVVNIPALQPSNVGLDQHD